MELGPLVVGVQSPNHWTTREFPFIVMLKQMKNGKLEGAEARRRLLQRSKRETMQAVIVGKKKRGMNWFKRCFGEGRGWGASQIPGMQWLGMTVMTTKKCWNGAGGICCNSILGLLRKRICAFLQSAIMTYSRVDTLQLPKPWEKPRTLRNHANFIYRCSGRWLWLLLALQLQSQSRVLWCDTIPLLGQLAHGMGGGDDGEGHTFPFYI